MSFHEEGSDGDKPGFERHLKEENELVRLVISETDRIPDEPNAQPQLEKRVCLFIWWIKAALWTSVALVVLTLMFKWGVPFLLNKVSPLCPMRFCI